MHLICATRKVTKLLNDAEGSLGLSYVVHGAAL
jgi:hypothetical protein